MSEERDNAADERAISRKKKKKAIADEQQIDELRALLKQQPFRRYIWRHITEDFALLRSAFSPNGSVQSYNIGLQDAARILFAELEEADPQCIPLMMAEWAEYQAAQK